MTHLALPGLDVVLRRQLVLNQVLLEGWDRVAGLASSECQAIGSSTNTNRVWHERFNMP